MADSFTLLSDGAGAADLTAGLATKQNLWTTTAVKTGTYTAAMGELVRCDASSGSFTVTLPAASGAGQVAVKLLATSGSFAVTVARAGSDTINNAATSVTLTLTDEALILTSNGAGVWTIAAGRVTTTSLDARYPLKYAWTPADHNLLAWTIDPYLLPGGGAPTVAGRLEFARLHLPAAASVTNIVMWATAVGATLTSGQCFAALYTSARVLVGQSADQAASWVSAGLKTMALAGGPYPLAAGDYFVAFWYNGTTSPSWARPANLASGLPNVGLATPSLRVGSADTGLTTTAPPTMGAQAVGAATWWAALS